MIENSKRIVFKFGTNILRNEKGDISLSHLYSFIEDISYLHKEGKEILLEVEEKYDNLLNTSNVIIKYDLDGNVVWKKALADYVSSALFDVVLSKNLNVTISHL